MRFHTYGDPAMPPIMLIHGAAMPGGITCGRLALWQSGIMLSLPTLDGHGEEAATPYVSTEKTADELLDYIDTHCSGHLFAWAGCLWRADRHRAAVPPGGCCPQGHHRRKFVYSSAGAGSFLHRVCPAVRPVDVQRKGLPLAAGHDAPDACPPKCSTRMSSSGIICRICPAPDGNHAYDVPHIYELSPDNPASGRAKPK